MRGASLALVAVCGLLTASCSAIITISEDEIRCFGEGASDPCPEGRVCRDGYCQLGGATDSGTDVIDGCVPDERGELCNGIDDNCNGEVDEGQDMDMDGFTWCGGGVAAAADCDDNDPTAYPGDTVTMAADEVCDGGDNDCDGVIDEDPPGGTICGGSLSCIDRECADPNDCSLPSVSCGLMEFCDFEMNPPRCQTGGCTPVSCTDPQICNEETGDCVTPVRIGDSCTTDEDCSDTAICADGPALGLTTPRVCTLACCNNTDCPSGTICWASGTGSKMCIRPELVGTSMGSTAGGMSCTNDADCRSGICDDDNACLEVCSRNSDCGDACTTTVLTDETSLVFACGAAKGGDTQGEAAFSGGCSSGLYLSGILGCTRTECAVICVGTCGSSEDCPSSVEDLEFYCGFGSIGMYSNTVAVCREKTHRGGGETPAMCANHNGCRDFTCLSGTCADTCCSDSDCSGSLRCRPVSIRSRWETHCLP